MNTRMTAAEKRAWNSALATAQVEIMLPKDGPEFPPGWEKLWNMLRDLMLDKNDKDWRIPIDTEAP